MEGNYINILERISKVSELDKEEIERRVEAKQAKLSGLISKEGALQIIAAELGISFDNERFKLGELLPGMRKVNTVAKIIRLFPVRSFTTKKGDEGKVANMIVADETSNTKVVLWDTNHIELIEKGEISEGDAIEILNGSMRDNEIHLGSFSEFKPSSESFEIVQTEKVVREKTISEFSVGDNVTLRAFVVQTFDLRFFNVCSQCKKKVTVEGDTYTCAEHGVVMPEKRALINVVLDDGTETIRAVLFNDLLPSLGFMDLNNDAAIAQQRENLLGSEMIFTGSVRMNNFFNNSEFIVEGVTKLNLDNLLSELESNA